MRLNPVNRRFNLATKFILLTGSLILITSLIITIFVIRNQIKHVYNELLDYGRSIAAMVAQNSEYGIYTEDRKTLEQIVENTGRNSDIVYVAVLNDTKRVLIEKIINVSVQIPTTLRNKDSQETEKVLYEDFVNKQDGYRYIDIIAPVVSFTRKDNTGVLLYDETDIKPKVIGYVQIGLSQSRLRQQVRQFLLSTVLFTSLLVLAGIAMTVLLTRRITSPLKKLTAATHGISEGNFDHNVEILTRDEISDLSQSFNTMLGYLRSYRSQVIEITSELSDANQRMRGEIIEREQTEEELIAARLRQEQLLKSIRSEKEFSDAIFNSAASGIMVLDKSGRILKINRTGAEILRLDAYDITGKIITDIYPETGDMLLIDKEIGREVTVSLPNGVYVPVGFRSSLLRASSEGKEGIIVLFRDMTEIKKLQSQLREKERFDTMGKIVAGVAHEVRNPLFGISSICQILEREISSVQHLALIQTVLKETVRVKDLIEELLIYTRPSRLYIEEIDVLTLVEEFEPYVKSKKDDIIFLINVPPSMKINAARDKIKQVFYSLLDNAIDAAKSTITVSGKTMENIVKIIISDDGSGIKKEDIGRIFEPFFTTKTRGTGLGLSICKKIVEDHGGSIEVQSSEGEGTSVTLTFWG